ncbi:Peptidase family M23 [Clostridium cavendishii DSM 21758]|uniref:Peptidase family M23 n=1 Tax=Clostridium cavendishii DSM 21758 TaxID=1121302 RepID=A0A1M6U2X8_9CLOT|nr:M23 family metallopeptidase [Clostridium cavendishii]SHK63536.1 Peptidase family M23 [Clostridium cavendishii DSM 21758]
MEKNNKFKKFIKKDGFYVVLFICLCIVATVAAFTAKKITKPIPKAPVADASVEINEVDKMPKTQVPDASLVKKDQTKDNAAKTTDKAKSVSNIAKVTFVAPIDNAAISKAYSTVPVITQKDSTTKRNLHGVNLEAKVGTNVNAAADGKVVEAGDSNDLDLGYYVKIKHADQSSTVYGNLAPELKVKVGDTVKQKQPIGKVGDTAKIYDKELFGEFLLFQIYNSKDEEQNPKNYIQSLMIKK